MVELLRLTISDSRDVSTSLTRDVYNTFAVYPAANMLEKSVAGGKEHMD